MAQTTPVAQLFKGFTDAYDSVKKQLGDGIVRPVLPLNKTLLLGSEGLAVLQKHLEETCQAEIAVTVDATTNSLFVSPLAPMSTPAPTKAAKTKKTTVAKDTGDKVPRPSNAFILYRKDWHSRIVAENPGLHNNQISVILGKQWRNESEVIRAAYKSKAEEAKHQHELAHPDYQYQPRKPSEKKRRMTKNKIAKLAKAQAEAGGSPMQQTLPDEYDPVALLNDTMTSYTEGQSIQITNFAQHPAPSQPALGNNDPRGWCTFNSGPDIEDRLLAGLQLFNEQHGFSPSPPQAAAADTTPQGTADPGTPPPPPPPPPPPQQPQVVTSRPSMPIAVAMVPLVNGEAQANTQQFPITPSGALQNYLTQQTTQNYSIDTSNAFTSGSSAIEQDQFTTGEVGRQDFLVDDFSTFIDMTQVADDLVPDHAGPAPLADAPVNSHTQQVAIEMPVDLSDYSHIGDTLGLDFSDDALGDLNSPLQWLF
ncbi:hypothetical protein LTR86_007555 [Recurvomyces mirabilis]|nr:hypothetical protein LTR86_007555 [Recurvomyces mirabilis]